MTENKTVLAESKETNETTAQVLAKAIDKKDAKTLEQKKRSWTAYVENDLVNMFTSLTFEKMTVTDGKGNKASLVKKMDGSINVKCESTSIL